MPDPPSVPRNGAHHDGRRNETLSRTVELTAQLLHVEKMDAFLQGITESVRSLFGFDRVSITVLDEERKMFGEPVMAGYSDEDRREALTNPEAFSVDEIMEDFREDCRVSRLAYYIPVEKQSSPADGFILVRDPSAAAEPRKGPDRWHELDLLYFALNDQRGNIIGYMQVDYPSDNKIPSLETIQEIELFASVAAVGIENSKMFKKTRGYLDLLTHDVGNLITPVDVYLDVVMGTSNLTGDQFKYLATARESARNITFLINNLRQSAQQMGGLHTFKVPQSMSSSLRQTASITNEDGPRVTLTDLDEVIKGVIEMEPLDVLLLRIARIVSVRFGIKHVLIGIRDDKTGLYKERVTYGYSADQLAKVKKQSYTLQRMKYDLRDEFLIGQDTYYVRPLDTGIVHKDDLGYVGNPELTYISRKTQNEWQELDFIDFMIKDKTGAWVGWLEILEPADRKVPSKDAVERIRVLADLAGIAVESDRLRGNEKQAFIETTSRLEVITEDIGTKLASLMHYQDLLAVSKGLSKEQTELLEKSSKLVRSTSDLVSGLRKLSEIKSSQDEPTEDQMLKYVLERCVSQLGSEFPEKKIEVTIECETEDAKVRTDRFIDELFMSLLRSAAKSDQKPSVKILAKVSDGGDIWMVELKDHGIGIPDEMKKHMFDGAGKGQEYFGETDLDLEIADLLISRYRGSITVRDRVHGKYSQGTCYEVRLPKALRFETALQGIEGK